MVSVVVIVATRMLRPFDRWCLPKLHELLKVGWHVFFYHYQNIYTKLQYNMYTVNASALWTHYIMRLCKTDLRNNNDKIVQPIEYKPTIPNTFHIERVNHCGLERKF